MSDPMKVEGSSSSASMIPERIVRLIKRLRIWVVVVPAVLVCVLPFQPLMLGLGAASRLPTYGALGSWLQGILTPVLLLVAILSFRSQSQAARKQTTAHIEANRTANRALFMTNADRFTQHIAYRVLCAIVDGTPADATQDPKIRSDVFNAMAGMFKGFPADVFMEPIPGHELHYLDAIQHSTHYLVLKRDIDEILAAARDAGLAMLLDNRISRIREGIKANPPLPPPLSPA